MASTQIPDRYLLSWGEGLCRHGCGMPLARPRNRFINGHDSKLLDLLLDAFKEESLIELRLPGTSQGMRRVSPLAMAEWAFFPKGYRWFRVKAGIDGPAYDEMAGAEDPVLSHLDMGSEVHSLEADLATVREVVAAASYAVDPEIVDRLEDELAVTRRQLEEVTSAADRLREANRRLVGELQEAVRPITVEQSGLVSLADREVLAAMQERARRAASVFKLARYDGLEGEVWDLVSMFDTRWVDPVRVRAARALLGQVDL